MSNGTCSHAGAVFLFPGASAKSKTEAHPPPRICPSLSRPPRITIVGRGTGCLSRPCIPSGCGHPAPRKAQARCLRMTSLTMRSCNDASMHKPGRHWGPHDARRDNSPGSGAISSSKSLLHICQQNYKKAKGEGNPSPFLFSVYAVSFSRSASTAASLPRLIS